MKTLLFALVTYAPVNRLLRTFFSLFQAFIPSRLLYRLPLVGKLRIALPGLKPFTFISNTQSSIAPMYWHGINGYEPGTIHTVLRVLQNSKTVLDLGAHQGIYTLIFASHPHVIQIHTFEPTPQTFAHLQRNVQVNQFRNVTLNQAAVSDHSGTITLYLPKGMEMPFEASTLPSFRSDTIPVDVRAVTLDDYTAEHHLTVDFIKIDTEATEPIVLAGGQAMIDRSRPIILCEVLGSRTEEALNRFFDSRNYKFFLVTERGLIEKPLIEGDRTYTYLNYLFIPHEKHAEFLP